MSFQIAGESIAHELWALLLVDEGVTEADVRTSSEAGVWVCPGIGAFHLQVLGLRQAEVTSA